MLSAERLSQGQVRLKNYFKHKTVWITLLTVILVMAVIFYLSAQTEGESSDTSGVLVNAFIRLFVPDFDELSASEQAASLHRITHTVRKLAHFTEYAVLGFLLALHINELRTKLNWNAKLWHGIVIGIAYAVSDECHQYFVPGRSPGIKDVCIDSLGVLTGAAILLCITALLRKSNE